MSDFFTRMKAEQQQLAENIDKLETFLDGDISGNSSDYIAYCRMQLHAMRSYLFALSSRISIIEDSASAG